MERLERPAKRRRGALPGSGLFVALAAMLVLSGCSSVPDYANPVEWYNSTVDIFSDDAPPPLPVEQAPGANEPFPELSATPETPLREIELATLDSIGEGLAADRANAQYTDEVIRSGSATVLVEPPVFEAELPTYQTETPAPPTLPPAPAPAPPPQPATALTVPPLESVAQQTAVPPAPAQPTFTEPILTPPVYTPPTLAQPVAVERGIDVRTMFANLFTSSGPRGVAPTSGGGLTAMLPAPTAVTTSIPLRSSTPLISAASGVVAGGAPHLGLNMAAVIYFDRGSARVDKRGRDALHKVADYLKQSRGALRVVGHASNRTKELSSASHELVNFNISFKRARAVADELIRRGVSPDRLKITALSDSAPVYREWMPSGEAGNRRAEVFIDF